jgi:uncharacterized membrane protein YgdD (TMEM256/DUF423 family)
MQALDRFAQGPYCLALLAGIAFTSVPFTPSTDELSQFFVWAGAFVFPLLVYIVIQTLPQKEFDSVGTFARYPGLAAAALFLVQVAAAYQNHPATFPQDTVVSAVGLYILFALLTVADLQRTKAR